MNFGDHVGCWQVLFPTPISTVARAADQPLVLRGDFSGTKVLLLSDLSRAGQSGLLAQTNDLHSDIVVAGLPSDGEPLCETLIAAIQPRVIVIADAELPATRRASRALKERLAQGNIPIIYTRQAGAVTLLTRPGGWVLQTMAGQSLESSE
jgi:beta-lactamase superfamily II metal-dependent hydrolase